MNAGAPPDPTSARTDKRDFGPEGGLGRGAIAAIAALVVLALGAGGWYWWSTQRAPAVPVVAAPAPAAAPPAAAPAPAASQPAILHPLEDAASAVAAPATPESADAIVRRTLADLLGPQSVSSLLQTDDFVRRVAATADNLGRAHAPSRLWPVTPTAGRFTVERAADGSERIAAGNARRYDNFVAFATGVDVRRAGAAYKTLYPSFQRAYQQLGYPQGYFNDRLVQVIDQLLATPEPPEPLAVKLTEVKGPAAGGMAADRPWVRYEYADPALEALPAGSKLLLRIGNDNARKLKAQLRAFRAEIAKKN